MQFPYFPMLPQFPLAPLVFDFLQHSVGSYVPDLFVIPLLHAHSVAISLLPQLAWAGLSLSHRYDELARSADVVQEAAAAALHAGFPGTAVERLEQGRSIVWGELFQPRSSYDELSSAHPNYASRFHTLSTQLGQASAAHEQSLSILSEQSQSTVMTLQSRCDEWRTGTVRSQSNEISYFRRSGGYQGSRSSSSANHSRSSMLQHTLDQWLSLTLQKLAVMRSLSLPTSTMSFMFLFPVSTPRDAPPFKPPRRVSFVTQGWGQQRHRKTFTGTTFYHCCGNGSSNLSSMLWRSQWYGLLHEFTNNLFIYVFE